MNKTPFRSALAALVGVALLTAPAPAAAEYLIPPGNSAATQYTEAIPTAGGRRDAERDDARGGKKRAPREVLGPRTTRELNAEGPAGRAVAEFAAETAPETSSQDGGEGSGAATGGGNGGGGGGTGSNDRGGATGGGGLGAVGTSGSGLGEVIAQATGTSSSGGLGLFLPLLIVATLAWAGWFALRHRRDRVDPDPSRW